MAGRWHHGSTVNNIPNTTSLGGYHRVAGNVFGTCLNRNGQKVHWLHQHSSHTASESPTELGPDKKCVSLKMRNPKRFAILVIVAPEKI